MKPGHLPLLAALLALLAASCSDDFVGSDAQPPADAGRDHAPPDQVSADHTLGPPVTLTLATFNVRNFFDAEDDPQKPFDPFPPEVTDDDVAAKIEELGAAIRAIDADVLALQEVENLPLLKRLNDEELGSLGYDHVRLVVGNDPRGIDVALLSRFAVVAETSHASDYFKGIEPGDDKNYGFSRDCLEITLEPSAGRRLVLLVNHLRATDWGDDEALSIRTREAQANRVRAIADATLDWEPDANLAVLGDLNDTPDSTTIQLLTGGTPALTDVLAGKPLEQRYTNLYKGDEQQIDYILASPGLEADLQSAHTDHSSVFSATSDHFPVVATFRLE